jgi:hypothetical protein
MKYTADLPHPVRCTTRTRRRSAASALIAFHWSSRLLPGQRLQMALRLEAQCAVVGLAQCRLAHAVLSLF